MKNISMAISLFLGDSHTCGYDTLPGQIGPGSFSVWQKNNYAELYAKENIMIQLIIFNKR